MILAFGALTVVLVTVVGTMTGVNVYHDGLVGLLPGLKVLSGLGVTWMIGLAMLARTQSYRVVAPGYETHTGKVCLEIFAEDLWGENVISEFYLEGNSEITVDPEFCMAHLTFEVVNFDQTQILFRSKETVEVWIAPENQ